MPQGIYEELRRQPVDDVKKKWMESYIAEEEARQAEIIRQLKIGGSEEYNNKISFMSVTILWIKHMLCYKVLFYKSF